MTHLRVINRSPATRALYAKAVERLQLAAQASDDPADLQRTFTRHLAARRDQVRPSTLNIELAGLRCWFKWLADVEPDIWRPQVQPKMRRVPVRKVWALSDAEVGMLLAAPDLTTYVGFRDHVMMATLYQCGLRAGELVKLQVGSIHPDGYLIVFGKGNKERMVPIGEHFAGLLDSFLHERNKMRPGKLNALFLTNTGRPLRDARSVWTIMRKYTQVLGHSHGGIGFAMAAGGGPWQGHYPHKLRTAFATELHRRGVDLMAVSQMLGHASVVTTALYLGVDMTQLRQAVSHHPRAKRLTA